MLQIKQKLFINKAAMDLYVFTMAKNDRKFCQFIPIEGQQVQMYR
jgi:hypothetical protein